MVNSFGKFCRKLRIDEGQLLAEMAKELGVSSAFLSKVENGGKKPPRDWRNKLIELYQLDEKQIEELDDCLFEAINSKSIDMSEYSNENREMLLSFARRLDTMDTERKDQIKRLLVR